MNKLATITASLLVAIISSSASANEAAELAAPTAALVAYDSALKKGDLDAAKDLTAKFKTIPAEAIDQYTAKYSEGAKAGKIVINPVQGSAKTIADFAVITFTDGNKKRPDYDPAYLIKQDGKWKVFLKLTKWDHPMFDLTDAQKKQLGELTEWFDAEKDRLYGR
jgi:hypothetical protein